ncbi:MAG TPA: M1 family aminopeptidase [Thermoanaerobaculaceae bacterium]|nr:M1 family aminopeptidase [Thermoanaerobaculaceae bacterium]
MSARVAIVAALTVLAARPHLAVAAAIDESFGDACARWSALALQAPSRPVAGLRIAAGHLVLTLEKGSAAPVLAGGEAVGIFFVGQGSLEYRTEDPSEVPVVTYNVKKNTGLKAVPEGKGLVIRDTFKEVLWLAQGAPLPALATEGTGESLAAAFAAHTKEFALIRETPPAQRFAAWAQNALGQPLQRGEMRGSSDKLVFVFDPVDDKSEALYCTRAVKEIGDRVYLTTLSEQLLGRTRQEPVAPRLLLVDADIAVTASAGKNVSLSVTEKYAAVTGRTGVIIVNLYDTTFGRSSLDQRHLKLKGVFDEMGTPLPFNHTRDSLAVELPTPIQPGMSVWLRFEIEGDILYRPEGDSYWQLGVEPWFPQPDMGGQYFTAHVTVKVPKPFVPFAPGTTVRRVEEGDYNVLETRLVQPVQFLAVLAGKYAYEEETKDGVTVRIASYAGKNTIALKKLMNLTQKIIAYYEGYLGPFPFKEFNVIEINELGYGQAPPAFMFITKEAFNPIGDDLNELFSKGINERFAHEIAHQYWGHVVKMPGSEEQWLTESFAEISAGLLIRDLRGKSDFKGLVATWRSRAKAASEAAPIPLANRLANKSDSYAAWITRTHLLYAKGPFLLNSIREQIGDKPFLIFLASCQSTFLWKFGNTRSVEAILEAVTKQDWKPFFDAYYWGTEMPAK